MPELLQLLDEALPAVQVTPSQADEHKEVVLALAEALSEFGIDGDALLRHVMARSIALAILAGVIFTELEASDERRPLLDAWKRLLKPRHHLVFEASESGAAVDEQTARDVESELARLMPPVVAWAENAPLDDIIKLSAPSEDQLEEYGLMPALSREVSRAYEWLWLRSTCDVDEWSTQALHQEYRYREGLIASPFADAALADVVVNELELLREIARRSVDIEVEDTTSEDRTFWAMQDHAKVYLQNGQHREAAALFEFYVRAHPTNWQAQNNLAFCRIPTHPAESLARLEGAAQAGYKHMGINVHNQCMCLIALGRDREALSRAEYFWQREQNSAREGGFLWALLNGNWSLRSVSDATQAVAELAWDLAKSLGQSDREKIWAERVSNVASSETHVDSDDGASRG